MNTDLIQKFDDAYEEYLDSVGKVRKVCIEMLTEVCNRTDSKEISLEKLKNWCYDNGEGVQQSYAEAVKWYRKVAEQGIAEAQYNLGVCYFYGKGVRRDYAEAVKWYRKAAEQGIAEAQSNLGVCYYIG